MHPVAWCRHRRKVPGSSEAADAPRSGYPLAVRSVPPTVLLAALLLACGEPQTDGPAAAPGESGGGDEGAGDDGGGDEEPVVLVDDRAWLTRLSLDLRGVRPSLEELEAVEADPEVMDALIDEMLADPRFSQRMAWLWNDTLHTAVFGASYTRFGDLGFETWSAMGQEPLQLIAAVIEEGRPFSEVVTASELRANGDLAELYPVSASGSDWSWTTWEDGRPAAGLLSSSTLWLRYTADAVNYNRTRANTVAGIFLCADFLERDAAFAFDISAESLADVERAVSTEPACLTCHASLDPLASFFGGFAEKSDELEPEAYVAYSDHLATWAATRSPPGYFGQPGADLADLGAFVAADPRFHRCVARRFHVGLTGEEPEELDLDELHLDFVAEGLDARALVGEIVRSEAYRAEGDRLVRNEQLHTALADALGWDPGSRPEDGLKALTWDVEHRVLAGGTDDVTVVERNPAAGIGLQVVLAWAARQAVPEAVAEELAREEADRVLLAFDVEDTGEEAVRTGLAQLHGRLLSRPVSASSEEVDRLYGLWEAAGGADDLEGAWSTVIMGLVRHPEQVLY